MAIMISKNLKCSSYRFVVVLLLLGTLLTTMVGRVQPVYALAELAPEIAPVYDTTIVQLSDYVENNLTQSQGDVFYILLGLALSGYAGSSDYELRNPNSSQGGVINWLKDCGAQFYNTLISSPFTNGLFIASDGTDLTPYISTWLSISLGYAMKASAYTDVNDFLSDVNAQDKYCVPLNYESMFAMNCILGKHNGLYDWQFSESEWQTTNFTWRQVNLGSFQSAYASYLASFTQPYIHINSNSSDDDYNIMSSALSENLILFLNTTNGAYTICPLNSYSSNYRIPFTDVVYAYAYDHTTTVRAVYHTSYSFYIYGTVNLGSFDNLVSAVDYIFNNYSINTSSGKRPCLSDFIQRVYVGASWNTKTLLNRTSDLNFLDVNTQYFLTRQDDFLLDIKGLLEDLVNTTHLRPTFINNIYNPDGTGIDIEDLIKVSVDAIIEAIAAPPIPVDLNEISEYTDNDYLDELKRHSQDFGETIGEYVAFWHNSNYEITYVLLGSIIIIMIGAFIGKWGHS